MTSLILYQRMHVDIFVRQSRSQKDTTQVTVRNLDPRDDSSPNERAKRAGRSFEQELREILSRATRPSDAELLAEAARIRAMSPKSLIDSTDIIREDRNR